MCFNNETWSVARVFTNIQNSADIIINTFSSDEVVAQTTCFVKWDNNNHHCHILNVDGSCLGSPARAGYGGIIRNNAGGFVSAFSGFLPGTICVLLAELTAILKGRGVHGYELHCN